MIKLRVKKNNLFKFIGLVGALFIVVFGNMGNFLRTIGLIGEKRGKKSK